ncbi:antiviral reverse transcriptase Drt2 [Nitrincola iocasae]|uniref:Reverse transcriptase domain-containing protein n=1 Tax=Nitrincola iocasae TaxID=2614693 RepID=A0A5J6LFT3_9GAMM|nr:antiviral reverse transcriptase Drt2 [Nitrincola iocasae]QEW07395.1 hypothetical protein F5I99_13340 [Nitrincola iocasae]
MDKRKHPWYRQRGYLHFDLPIGFKKASFIVKNPTAVAKYSFWPLIDYQIIVEKLAKSDAGVLEKKTKERPIAYAAHLDSHIYAYYSHILSSHYEKELLRLGLEQNVLAFRSLGKSNIHFANDAFNAIRAFGPCGVVGVDISGFFDNLDHMLLKKRWCDLLGKSQLPLDHYRVFRSLTHYASVNRDELYSTLGIAKHNPKHGRKRVCSPKEFDRLVRSGALIKKNDGSMGIPQGSPISALLSNIYMLKFDQHMAEAVNEWGGHYFRYCDDMLFIVPKEFTDSVAGMVARDIKALNLTINTKKTERRIFDYDSSGSLFSEKPLQYLGFLFNGQNIFIRSAAFARFSERMKRGVTLAKSTCRKRNKTKIRRGKKTTTLYKRKLYDRYSHLGKRNFIRYAIRAAEIMESKTIKRQIKPLWRNLQDEINQ